MIRSGQDKWRGCHAARLAWQLGVLFAQGIAALHVNVRKLALQPLLSNYIQLALSICFSVLPHFLCLLDASYICNMLNTHLHASSV